MSAGGNHEGGGEGAGPADGQLGFGRGGKEGAAGELGGREWCGVGCAGG